MVNNKLKWAIIALAIVIVILVILYFTKNTETHNTIFHTPWFDIVK